MFPATVKGFSDIGQQGHAQLLIEEMGKLCDRVDCSKGKGKVLRDAFFLGLGKRDVQLMEGAVGQMKALLSGGGA